MTVQISDIKYKNKVIDRGLIIGSRKYRFLLKKHLDPCWAKHYKRFISQTTPHKKFFEIYIPFSELKLYRPITICNSGRKEIFITELTENTVSYRVKDLPEPKQIKFEVNYDQVECPF